MTSAPSGLGRLAPEVPEAPPFALLEPSKAAIYRRGAAALAAISLGIALTVLVGGWTLGARTLRSFGPGYAEMFANAAIAVALISTTVMIHALGRPRPGWRGLARGLNLLACTIALATLLEWVAGASLGIDDLLFTASSSGFGTSHPGRIPPNTVVVLLLLSGAVELTLAARRATLRQWLGIGAATVSLVAFLGYATQTTKLYGIASGARMALPTSLALGALSIALLASQPTSGLMAYLTRASPGARMARLLLPAVIVIPAGLSILRFAATRRGLVSTSVGVWWVELLTIALFCAITVIYAAALDAGEQQRRLQALITSRTEQRFRELLELALDAVIVRDPESRVTFWNREAEHVYGYTRAEVVGHPIHELLATEFPESREAVDEALEQTGQWAGVLRHRRKDGETISVSSRKTLQRDPQGQPVAIIELNSDITERVRIARERQRARDQLEEAERTAGLGSWRFHPASETWQWSAGMYLLHDRDPSRGPMDTAELRSRVHPADRARFEELQTRIRTGGEAFETGYRVLTSTGEVREMRLIVTPDPPMPGWYSGALQDVTHAREIERALREQTGRAERASRAKGEFLSRMSHELRTPLNAIIGFSQVLALDDLAPRHQQDVGYILKAGNHLLGLVNEVLDLARIESGKLTISLEPVALADAISDVLTLLAPLARERNVSLHTDTSALAHDGHVLADRQRLGQVLLNLISNAIKYNRAGGRVDISFQITNARVRTLIADTGIGIAPEHRAQLFEPFERLGAEQTDVEGTGLGLALSNRLIEAMGGTIEIDTTPGAGSTFTIELATSEPPSTQHPPHPGDDEAAELTSPHARRRLILYIEDNLSNLTLVQRILARHDTVELISAMQGTLGLELARQHHPDLVILDLHLPDIDGADVLKRLNADQPDIPVIVLTADASERQAETARCLGAADYLTKPLDVRRFLDTINTHLTPPDDTPHDPEPTPQAPADH